MDTGQVQTALLLISLAAPRRHGGMFGWVQPRFPGAWRRLGNTVPRAEIASGGCETPACFTQARTATGSTTGGCGVYMACSAVGAASQRASVSGTGLVEGARRKQDKVCTWLVIGAEGSRWLASADRRRWPERDLP